MSVALIRYGRRRQWRCAKLAYPSQVDALLKLKALELLTTRGERPYAPVTAYRCRRCGRWHLTSREPRA